MRVEPYLFFPGTCEEALTFYSTVFGGEVTGIMRYGDMPPGSGHSLPPGQAQRIMHAVFTSGSLTLMGADSPNLEAGQAAERVSLSLAPESVEEGGRIFSALSAGGEVLQPYAKQFWGATFGMCTDKFGIDWMVNAGGD